MLSMSEIKLGKVIKWNDQPYVIVKTDHIKKARAGAVLKVKMKNLLNGSVIENSFQGNDKAEEADLERGKKAQYLYKDADNAHFMDQDSFEQFGLPVDQIEQQLNYLPEGQDMMYMAFEGNPVALDLPPKVKLKVTEAPDGAKGDSAQGRVTKTVVLETGYEVQAPLFVKVDDILKINTETGEYVERVKE
jgi:elongation factor P